MAEQYLQRMGGPAPFINLGSPSASSFACDGSTDGIAFVCLAPTTDPITHIGWRYGLRAGTPPTYITGFEGLSSGNPDGTYKTNGGNCSGTFTPPADTTWDNLWQWMALDNTYSPAAIGEYLCGTIRYSTGTINSSNYSSFANEIANLVGSGTTVFPYSARLTAGSWAKRTSTPAFGIRTATARYGMYWSGHYTTVVTTSGHRSALKFRLESNTTNTFQLAGFRAWCAIGSSTGQSPKACVWSASSELAGVTLSTTNDHAPSTRAQREFLFSSLVSLDAGTDYYIGLQAVGGSLGLAGFQLADAGDRAMFPGAANWHLATYNGSAWSDDTTVRPQLELILADMTQSSGGGSGAIIIPGGMGQLGVAIH